MGDIFLKILQHHNQIISQVKQRLDAWEFEGDSILASNTVSEFRNGLSGPMNRLVTGTMSEFLRKPYKGSMVTVVYRPHPVGRSVNFDGVTQAKEWTIELGSALFKSTRQLALSQVDDNLEPCFGRINSRPIAFEQEIRQFEWDPDTISLLVGILQVLQDPKWREKRDQVMNMDMDTEELFKIEGEFPASFVAEGVKTSTSGEPSGYIKLSVFEEALNACFAQPFQRKYGDIAEDRIRRLASINGEMRNEIRSIWSEEAQNIRNRLVKRISEAQANEAEQTHYQLVISIPFFVICVLTGVIIYMWRNPRSLRGVPPT